MDLHQLTQELPYQWKIQALRNGTATCVAYIDARDAMRLLDKVSGPENWQDKYYEACGQLFCTVSIKTDSGWVEKSDSGIVTADTAKVDLEMTQKGSASDAFKRACVKWGIGRFLYDLDVKRLPEAVFEANKWNLTDYINGLKGKAPAPVAPVAKTVTKPAQAPAAGAKWFNHTKYKSTEDAPEWEQLIKDITAQKFPSAEDYIMDIKTRGFKIYGPVEQEIRDLYSDLSF